jgi:acetyl esterase/lipase
MAFLSRVRFASAGLTVCVAVAAFATVGRLHAGGPEPRTKKYEVRADRGITYYAVKDDPDAARHKLDVYRPAEKGRYPVLLLLHGGAWMMMSKDDVFGVLGYGTVARCLAERGLVVVVPNYRLSPGVRHPEHVKDVARAFDWTVRHCEKYGGDRKNIFVGGHSAGGHLAALLAADDSYLKQVGRAAKDVRGVVGVSGVYRLDAFDMKWLAKDPKGDVEVKGDIRPLAMVFGDDPEVIRKASPVHLVRPGLPPFLLLSGGWDYPPMRRMAREFAAALRTHGVAVEEKEVPRRTHETLLFDIPRLTADADAVEAIVQFIRRHMSTGEDK